MPLEEQSVKSEVNAVVKIGAGTALIGKVGIDQTTPGTTNAVVEASASGILTAVQLIDNFITGSRGMVTEDSAVAIKTAIEALRTAKTLDTVEAAVAELKTLIVLAAGTALIGKVGIDQTTPGTTNNVVRGTNALTNSGVKSADVAVKASAGLVYWMTVSDTANLAIEINDSVAGAGTDVWALDLPAGGYGHFIFDPPLVCGTGIYLDVSTVTCKVTIGYK